MAPDDKVICTYRIESPFPAERAAQFMAANMSAGTFTKVPGESKVAMSRFSPAIEAVRPLVEPDHSEQQAAEVVIAIPLDLTGTDMATLLSVVAGGVMELRELTAIRLIDIELPAALAGVHPGPQFGIAGTRELTGVYDRPIIASIIKPNVGLSPEQTADMVSVLAAAGVDFIKDDEKMTSPAYSPLAKRVEAVMRAINDEAQRTGKKTMFAFNISADDPETLVRNHDIVLAAGGTCVMVSINHIGYGGIRYLRRHSQLPIHAHRNGWGMWTRCRQTGMEFNAYNKLWRMVGIDHLHVNGIRNKYWESDDSVVNAIRQCLKPLFSLDDRLLPVVGSGMWADQLPDTYARTQTTDFMYIAGGGIQAHPGGPAAGVTSLMQAWEAAVASIPLAEYAETHPELKQALEKFGKPKTN